MKENLKVKCHICNFETTSKGIGRHYHNRHGLKLSENPEVYLMYFDYNNPGILDDIKNMIRCGIGLKSIQKKYDTIGLGSLPILKKSLADIYPDDFTKKVTDRSRETYFNKTGTYYSDKFNEKKCGFRDKILAKKAAKIASTNASRLEKLSERLKSNNPSHSAQTIEKRKKTYHNKTEDEKIAIIEKRLITCNKNQSYLKRAETIVKKYGGFVNYGNKTAGHSNWHDGVKQMLIKNNIITISEKTVVNNYTSDEVNLEKKIIIELNGDFWHCNPKYYDNNYYHPFIKMTAKEIWDKDEKRISDYIKNGWRVVVIWESDDLNEKIKELKEIYG